MDEEEFLKISSEDYNHRQDMLYGTTLENKELHSIIKHLLGIEGDRNYIPEAYKEYHNNMLINKKDEE